MYKQVSKMREMHG
jgi:tubulin polyglutamylase TTLL5